MIGLDEEQRLEFNFRLLFATFQTKISLVTGQSVLSQNILASSTQKCQQKSVFTIHRICVHGLLVAEQSLRDETWVLASKSGKSRKYYILILGCEQQVAQLLYCHIQVDRVCFSFGVESPVYVTPS